MKRSTQEKEFKKWKSNEVICPSDVVWIELHEKHWHGATPTTAMTHIAVVEKAEEDSTGWMEHVSDEQYLAG